MCNTIKMALYNGCSQLLHISLKAEKSFIAHPDACCPLLALRSIQLMTGEPRPRYSALQLLGESGDCDLVYKPGPLFTKRADVLPQDLMKSWNRKIRV